MEEYVREAPQIGSVSKRLEYQEREESPEKSEEPEDELIQEEEEEEEEPEEEPEPEPESTPFFNWLTVSKNPEPLFLSGYFPQGLQEINPNAAQIEESNALALAIIPPGINVLTEFSGTSGWELALVRAPSNINNTPPQETKLNSNSISLRPIVGNSTSGGVWQLVLRRFSFWLP